ncbi:hypothetical protein OO013_13700 [Mangrovivirga sp. M17]|uniref:Uncharacterized protein n=1 Tax=Mangrovivirga halotolerans TaxID=2993936 RepID=A0ABT3RT06_9BACT|nr:hypothetical protein [Mangrovivirga halotolerans]MCX2744932.1 hypothetical protein [Mangrovivirga halotolerans]
MLMKIKGNITFIVVVLVIGFFVYNLIPEISEDNFENRRLISKVNKEKFISSSFDGIVISKNSIPNSRGLHEYILKRGNDTLIFRDNYNFNLVLAYRLINSGDSIKKECGGVSVHIFKNAKTDTIYVIKDDSLALSFYNKKSYQHFEEEG